MLVEFDRRPEVDGVPLAAWNNVPTILELKMSEAGSWATERTVEMSGPFCNQDHSAWCCRDIATSLISKLS